MKKKRVRGVIIIFSILIIVFHICWFYNYSLYLHLTDGLDEFVKFQSYSILEDNFIYHVKRPSYMSFTGNLAISTKDGEYTLIIWLSRFKSSKYGIILPIGNDRDESISLMIDKNLMTENEYDQIFIEENREQIEELFYRAYVRWGDRVE